jgi:methylated-DNA-[protein]-cysteine S-methyltransferase
MPKHITAYLQTTLGAVEIQGTLSFITAVNFVEQPGESSQNLPAVIERCIQELQEYFEGNRRDFSVDVNPEGTEFQKKVWNELMRIKYGDTTSYGQIAKKLNDENASQAVGHANGKNPIAIIIPCHRVIGHNGQLTGYAGGAWRKEWLLKHEGNISGKNLTLF